jgi:hypothetical protein
MVANEVQAENALYGEYGAVSGAHMNLIAPIMIHFFNCTNPSFCTL